MSDPISRAAMPLITTTEIVCGDCAGEARVPCKTLLTSDGACAGCGGGNYQLACDFYAPTARTINPEAVRSHLLKGQR
jgi:hypothetical protein